MGVTNTATHPSETIGNCIPSDTTDSARRPMEPPRRETPVTLNGEVNFLSRSEQGNRHSCAITIVVLVRFFRVLIHVIGKAFDLNPHIRAQSSARYLRRQVDSAFTPSIGIAN